MAILPAAAGLTDIFSFRLRLFSNCFFVSDLRLPDISFNFKLALHTVNDNFEMQLAHARDNRLERLRIRTDAKCRIFFRKPPECQTHFLLVCFRFWFDFQINDRLREHNPLKQNRVLWICKRIASSRPLEPDDCRDFSRIYFFHFFAVIRMHPKNTADAFFFVFRHIINI